MSKNSKFSIGCIDKCINRDHVQKVVTSKKLLEADTTQIEKTLPGKKKYFGDLFSY